MIFPIIYIFFHVFGVGEGFAVRELIVKAKQKE